MGRSVENICNVALRLVGADSISDFDDDTTREAVICRTFYEIDRDTLLSSHPWIFAIKRQVLTSPSITNYTTYDYVYQLPEDPYCLRVLALLDEEYQEAEYDQKIEGRYLYTNLQSASLLYVGKVTDPDEFDPQFARALSFRLAVDIARPLKADPRPDLEILFEAEIRKAFGNDALQQAVPRRSSDKWIDERFD